MRRTALVMVVAAATTLAVFGRRRRRDVPDLVRRYFDAWADGDAEGLRDLLTDDYCGHVHTLAGTETRDDEELAAVLRSHGDAFEWTEFDVRDVLRDDGRLAARVAMRTRHRETGREGEIEGIAIFRLEDGQIAEEWSSWDYLGLAGQLGLANTR
jgi:ketosteroid isomerase-like protein